MLPGSDPGETSETRPNPTTSRRLGVRSLTAIFAVECLALSVFELPKSLSMDWFLQSDLGANLTAQSLLDRGLRPTIDFGYIYGLAPLLVGRAWFALFGASPVAYTAAMTLARVLIAWGLARCVSSLNVGAAGIALIIFGMPLAAACTHLNFVHAIEAVLVCHALADQASGRKPRALALLTATLFMKPALAYFYGLFLVILIVRSEWRSGVGAILKALAPAAATGLVMAAILAAWFGPMVVVRTLLPTTGAVVYKLHDYGFFFGRGRKLWLPENASLRYYFMSPAASYLGGVLFLTGAAAVAIRRLARLEPGQADRTAEIIACAGLLQVVFVTLLYADWTSYEYYYYVLAVGLIAASTMGRKASIAVGILAAAEILSYRWPSRPLIQSWKSSAPSRADAWLWSSEPQYRELARIRDLVKGRTGSFLNPGSCFEMIEPGFAPAENFFIVAGYNVPAELERKSAQIDRADILVTPRGEAGVAPILLEWPEIRAKIDEFDELPGFEYYHVHQRRAR